MPYVTLLEAAQIIDHQTGVDITVPQLIRYAANSGLPLCVLLNVRCYSPTKRIRREKQAEEEDPNYWSKPTADDAKLDDAYGLYVLPPRHIFDYQSKDTVCIDYVTSLDGLDTYKPFTDVSRDALQITMTHLNRFIEHIKANQPNTAPVEANPAPTLEAVTPAPVVETINQRRTRYLKWFTEEQRIVKRGALGRVYERELLTNPKAERSVIGRDIKSESKRTSAPKGYGAFTSQRVIDGKRQN